MSLLSFLARNKSEKGLTGICFQDDGISYAHVERDKTTHVVLDICEFAPLETNETHETLLQRLVNENLVKKSPCVCVMPPDSYSLFQVEAPEVQPDELRAAVRWGIKDIIDFHIDDAVIDVFDIPGQVGQGGSKMMYVVATRATEVERQADMLHNAGLTIQAIDINELALRNVITQMKQDVDGIVLISFTRTSGLISLLHQGSLYLTRNIQIGSDRLREAFDASKTTTASAGTALTDLLDRQVQMGSDELREAFNAGKEGDMAPGTALTDLLDSIVLELQYSLDYYESHFSAPPMQQVVIAPLEQDIPGMIEYLSGEFSLPLSTVDFGEFLDCPNIIQPSVQARCSATVGAALRQET